MHTAEDMKKIFQRAGMREQPPEFYEMAARQANAIDAYNAALESGDEKAVAECRAQLEAATGQKLPEGM